MADLLRDDYKPSEYGRVMLPFTVLCRLDCVLDPVKDEMLTRYESVKGRVESFGPVLDALTDIDGLWNTSRFDLPKLLNDPDSLADNLRAYIHGFSPESKEILDKFDFRSSIWTTYGFGTTAGSTGTIDCPHVATIGCPPSFGKYDDATLHRRCHHS